MNYEQSRYMLKDKKNQEFFGSGENNLFYLW